MKLLSSQRTFCEQESERVRKDGVRRFSFRPVTQESKIGRCQFFLKCTPRPVAYRSFCSPEERPEVFHFRRECRYVVNGDLCTERSVAFEVRSDLLDDTFFCQGNPIFDVSAHAGLREVPRGYNRHLAVCHVDLGVNARQMCKLEPRYTSANIGYSVKVHGATERTLGPEVRNETDAHRCAAAPLVKLLEYALRGRALNKGTDNEQVLVDQRNEPLKRLSPRTPNERHKLRVRRHAGVQSTRSRSSFRQPPPLILAYSRPATPSQWKRSQASHRSM